MSTKSVWGTRSCGEDSLTHDMSPRGAEWPPGGVAAVVITSSALEKKIKYLIKIVDIIIII